MADLQMREEMGPLSEGPSALALIDVCLSWIYPAALRAVVQLDVPHILATHGTPPDMAMTAEELVQHLQPEATCPSANKLERLLRLLTIKGIFAEHINIDNNNTREVVRRFSLTRLSTDLLPGDGTFRNRALLLTLGPEYAASLEHLADSVLKSEAPFTMAHGMNQFEYMKTHPAFLESFKMGVRDASKNLIPRVLSQYNGFKSIHKLMDVGGGSGSILAHIVEKYPHIYAINFDLPEVVASNPSLPSVEQVGGDMFEKVPSGCDAIFMKGILHDWNDEECLKILKNCYAALPSGGGKLIMVDLIMPQDTVLDSKSRLTLLVDMLMQIHCENGRERTAVELEGLLKQAGFTNFQIVGDVAHLYIMEAFK